MPIFCTQCGAEVSNTARFCSNCGVALQNLSPSAARPLRRPIVGGKIAGVCLSLAQAYGWDVAVVRVLAVLGLLFTAGVVPLVYLIFWIGIPKEKPFLS